MEEDQTMEDKQAILNAYQNILNFIPGLEEQTKWMQRNQPSRIPEIATLVCA